MYLSKFKDLRISKLKLKKIHSGACCATDTEIHRLVFTLCTFIYNSG